LGTRSTNNTRRCRIGWATILIPRLFLSTRSTAGSCPYIVVGARPKVLEPSLLMTTGSTYTSLPEGHGTSAGQDGLRREETPHPSGAGWRKRRRRKPSPQGRGLYFQLRHPRVQSKWIATQGQEEIENRTRFLASLGMTFRRRFSHRLLGRGRPHTITHNPKSLMSG
jgi:hypothetical protein